jgi:hypothetical protein
MKTGASGGESGAETSTLPELFVPKWTVGRCKDVDPKGTGLVVGDQIEIEEGAALKITLVDDTVRKPKPLLLENARMTVVRPDNGLSQNVLTDADVTALCVAGPEKFAAAFWTVLFKHNFNLTYLAGVSALHSDEPGELTLTVFLPYVLEERSWFFLAVIDLGGDNRTGARNHNGIVHGPG